MDIIGSASVSTTVEQLVEGAQKQLVLVTPYFKPWDRIGRAIKAAKTRGVVVLLLLRGGEDRAKQEAHARDFLTIGVHVGFLSRLHAKIYMTESEVIVTSMNLYDDSALNSWEVAIRFRADVDEAAYKEVKARIAELGKRADEEAQVAALEKAHGDPVLAMAQKWRAENPTQVRAAPVAAPRAAASRPSSPSRASAKGHCIRCSTPGAVQRRPTAVPGLLQGVGEVREPRLQGGALPLVREGEGHVDGEAAVQGVLGRAGVDDADLRLLFITHEAPAGRGT